MSQNLTIESSPVRGNHVHIPFKARQKDALKHIWAWDNTDKQDLIVNLPTGYGKSIIFQMLPDLLSTKHRASHNAGIFLSGGGGAGGALPPPPP